MARQRIMLEVLVDLDPMPGVFHTPESAREVVDSMLLSRLPHYNPIVMVHEEETITVKTLDLSDERTVHLTAFDKAKEMFPDASLFALRSKARDIADFIKEGR